MTFLQAAGFPGVYCVCRGVIHVGYVRKCGTRWEYSKNPQVFHPASSARTRWLAALELSKRQQEASQ